MGPILADGPVAAAFAGRADLAARDFADFAGFEEWGRLVGIGVIDVEVIELARRAVMAKARRVGLDSGLGQ